MTDQLYNRDAEEAVLCAMLMSRDAIQSVTDTLTDTMFVHEPNHVLFRTIATLAQSATEIDPLTVIDAVQRAGDLDRVGGREYIAYLVDIVPTAANVSHYAGIVRELANRRDVIAIAERLIRTAHDRRIALQSAAQEATAALLPTAASTTKTGYRHVREIIPDVITDLEAAVNGTHTGFSFGYRDLDTGTGGVLPGELVFLCAVPGGCKTALALNIAVKAAHRGEGVAVVSAEMKDRALLKRLAGSRAQVSSLNIRSGKFSDDDYIRLGQAFGELTSLPLWIDDTALPDIRLIQARARALKAAHPEIRWVIVDFIQLVQGSGSDDEIRALELTTISYALKGLAKELDCIVIATCQVDASGVEKRSDKRPQLSDLRWSQGMREAADLVAMLYRPAMYELDAVDDIEIDFKKARDLPPFKAYLRWIGQFMRVDDRTRYSTTQEAA